MPFSGYYWTASATEDREPTHDGPDQFRRPKNVILADSDREIPGSELYARTTSIRVREPSTGATDQLLYTPFRYKTEFLRDGFLAQPGLA